MHTVSLLIWYSVKTKLIIVSTDSGRGTVTATGFTESGRYRLLLHPLDPLDPVTGESVCTRRDPRAFDFNI